MKIDDGRESSDLILGWTESTIPAFFFTSQSLTFFVLSSFLSLFQESHPQVISGRAYWLKI